MITINLLPEDIRENIDFSRKNKKILATLKVIVILCIFTLSALIICWVSLINSNHFFVKEVYDSEKVVSDYQPVIDKQKDIEAKMKSAQKVKSGYKYWTKFDKYLYANVPTGMYLSFVNTTSGIVNINGYSLTKKDIGFFRDALENTDAFSQVNIEQIKETDDPTQAGRTINFFTMTAKTDTEATSKGAIR